jgi:hypothetical protein
MERVEYKKINYKNYTFYLSSFVLLPHEEESEVREVKFVLLTFVLPFLQKEME